MVSCKFRHRYDILSTLCPREINEAAGMSESLSKNGYHDLSAG